MKQQGYATVEFAMVGLIFLTVLFGLFEVGRMLFTWNTLTEMTRRGARTAINCPVEHVSIQRLAIFNAASSDAESSIIPGIYPQDIHVEYLDEEGNVIASPTSNYLFIRFVRVSIDSDFQYHFLAPGVSSLIDVPEFATTLPIESLGVPREGEVVLCNGIAS